MKKFKSLIAVLLVLALLFTAAGCSAKTEQANAPAAGAPGGSDSKAAAGYSRAEPLKLSFAKLGNDGEFDNQRPAAHYLMDLVTKYSNGKITFDFFPGGQLGSESDMLDQVISGDLDIAMLSDGTYASVTPEVSMSLTPFLFNSSKEFYDVASLESGSAYQKALVKAVDNHGLFKYIAPMNGLFRALSNSKRTIDSIDDLKGINMRIQPGDIYTDSYKALGASTATIAFAELYTSLQQKAVDGEDCSFPFYYGYKFYEVEPYTTEMRMFFQTINMIVSNDTWNKKFTEEDRQIFMKAAQEAQRLGFLDQYKMDEDVLNNIAKTNVKLTRYSDLKEENIAAFRSAVKPVWDKYSKKNETVWKALQDTLAAYRK